MNKKLIAVCVIIAIAIAVIGYLVVLSLYGTEGKLIPSTSLNVPTPKPIATSQPQIEITSVLFTAQEFPFPKLNQTADCIIVSYYIQPSDALNYILNISVINQLNERSEYGSNLSGGWTGYTFSNFSRNCTITIQYDWLPNLTDCLRFHVSLCL
jgi:hypothetical protein